MASVKDTQVQHDGSHEWDAHAPVIPIDPNQFYPSALVAQTWRMSKETRQAWYAAIRRIQRKQLNKQPPDVRVVGHHFVVTGQVAFDALADI